MPHVLLRGANEEATVNLEQNEAFGLGDEEGTKRTQLSCGRMTFSTLCTNKNTGEDGLKSVFFFKPAVEVPPVVLGERNQNVTPVSQLDATARHFQRYFKLGVKRCCRDRTLSLEGSLIGSAD